MATSFCFPPDTGLPLSAVLLRTARAALEITAEEMAEAAGCDVALVRRIESGEHDPVMDTVGRLVSAVGLELRCGTRSAPNPAYLKIEPEEVSRLAGEIARFREWRGRFGNGLPKPMHQLEWDGVPPAPPHMFGAGPTRRHDGGWAAMLTGLRWDFPNMTRAEITEAAGISEAALSKIEEGVHRPPMSVVQQILTAIGIVLYVHLEVYDQHDDQLHHRAMKDPDRYQRVLESNKQEFAPALTIS